MNKLELIVVDPGHFHAALAQKEMYPNLSPQVRVYAPVGPDLVDYLTRIARFNNRAEAPTGWELDIHAAPDFIARMARGNTGKVAIFAGRNGEKIAGIASAVEAGIHVLSDKPMIVRRADLPALTATLDAAEAKGLVVQDMMGGRQEVTRALTRLIHADPEVFGEQLPGTAAEPGVEMTSVHHLLKVVELLVRRGADFLGCFLTPLLDLEDRPDTKCQDTDQRSDGDEEIPFHSPSLSEGDGARCGIDRPHHSANHGGRCVALG